MVQKKYCGIGPVPKGRTRGNMIECAKNNQIRYYGYKKVDAKVMEIARGKREKVKDKNYYIQEISKRRGKLKNLKSRFDLLENDKRLDKEYDKNEYKKLKSEIFKIEKEYDELKKEYEGLDKKTKKKVGVVEKIPEKKVKEVGKKKGGAAEKFKLLRGGKISAKLLKELFEKEDFKDVPPYVLDKDLSTEWVRVLHDPKTNHTIVVHRGSSDWYDALVDAGLAVGYKKNKRFKESKRIQEAAEKKYGTSNMSVVGSSLGATLAEDYGKNASEIITSGKPVTPLDLITGKKPHDTQHDVRTNTDIISFLKVLQPHKNDISVKSIKSSDPLKSHLGKHTMEAVMDKYGEDVEIGEEGVGARVGGQEVDLKKYNVKQLKEFIKINRRVKKLKATEYQITGLRKPELVRLAEKVRDA